MLFVANTRYDVGGFMGPISKRVFEVNLCDCVITPAVTSCHTDGSLEQTHPLLR